MAAKSKATEPVEGAPTSEGYEAGHNNPFVQEDMALIEANQRSHPEPALPSTHAAFVPDGDSRTETARLLVTTARDNEIDQASIQATQGGFNITEELADLL